MVMFALALSHLNAIVIAIFVGNLNVKVVSAVFHFYIHYREKFCCEFVIWARSDTIANYVAKH